MVCGVIQINNNKFVNNSFNKGQGVNEIKF